jgi:hypothetical protein
MPNTLVIIGKWARLFTHLTTFRMMTCSGESNGSAVLVTTPAFQPTADGYLLGTITKRFPVGFRNSSVPMISACISIQSHLIWKRQSHLIWKLTPRADSNSCLATSDVETLWPFRIVVTVPLKNYRSVPVEPLAGKVVIDTNNYYPQRDGHFSELDSESTTTSDLLQAHLPASKVVKAFNHIYAAELTTHGQPAGSANRRALAIFGNDADAKATVTQLLDQFGFDTVDGGPLSESWRIQRDTPGYGPRRTSTELRKDLEAAKSPVAQ